MKTPIFLAVLLVAATLPAASAARADESVPPVAATSSTEIRSAPSSTWRGEAEAGVVDTAGNTDTQSINTKLKIEHERARWKQQLNAEFFKASDSSRTTAERTSAALRTDYKLNEFDYLFALARYDSDRFSGYYSQYSETAGYGRSFHFGARTRLDAETGAGGRQTSSTDGSRRNDTILRLALKCTQSIGPATEFREEAFTEAAEHNTHTESTTSLKSKINGSLSMKAAFTVTHNSQVPQGVKRTDTITSLTLVYDL